MSTTEDGHTLPASRHEEDFTEAHYRQLLRLAKTSYPMIGYDEVASQSRFLLWRHDCDFSLNRALALAGIEHAEGVRATYFVNLHSEFYNVLEKSQAGIVHAILDRGHALGLHFDAAFHDVSSESDLDDLVASEARLLKQVFGVNLQAFSFHNPTEFALACEKPAYGGLINCYSERFKSEIAYCSDSNGYWRHRRLQDVLTLAADAKLQVLTHPDWWQVNPMHPRERVHRATYGRARANLNLYDKTVEAFGRTNIVGPSSALVVIREVAPDSWELCDYLWNEGELGTLFLTLWRLHEARCVTLCRSVMIDHWKVPSEEADDIIDTTQEHRREAWEWLLEVAAVSDDEPVLSFEEMGRLSAMKDDLVGGASGPSPLVLEEACKCLCQSLEGLQTPVLRSGSDDMSAWNRFRSVETERRMKKKLGGTT